jgi:hypothetical protein
MTVEPQSGKPSGPAPTGKGTPIQVRLQPDALARLDAWIAAQPDNPSRPEAIRRLFELGLPRTVDVSVSGEEHSWGGAAVMTQRKPRKLK